MVTETLTGTVLRGPEYTPHPGRVRIEDGTIVAIEETGVDSTSLIAPAFVNGHTHLGDSIAKGAGRGLSLTELVAPPDGLKHRLLDQADRETLITGMRRSLAYMEAAGTAATLEFREGGVPGVTALREAADETAVTPIIFGRGSSAVLEHADGFGASGANDGDFTTERAAAADMGKLFGIHAGEVDETDVTAALDLVPDFIVHGVHLTEAHHERIAAESVPVVACPRSNLATNVGQPPLQRLAAETTVALGTDNVMLNAPSLFREMELAAKLYDLPASEVLAMATRNPASIAGLDIGVVEEGRPAALQVLDLTTNNLAGVQDPLRGFVRRAEPADVSRLITP